MALLPSYARVGAKFFCSPAFYHGAMLPLLASAGGVTGMEIVNGYPVNKFLGYPVVLCESIASAAAINTIFMYFGNLQQASKLGDRQQISIAASDSATVGGYSVFERNQIALRAVERFDINVHDVGVAGASAGAIVGLISHTS
jgi:HK97 family phage major capsid protein